MAPIAPPVTAFILCGGLGNRWTGSLDEEWWSPKLGVDRQLVASLRGTSKILAPIAGVPLVVHKMRLLAHHGVSDFVIRLGYYSRHIAAAIDRHADPGWKVEFLNEHVATQILSQVLRTLGDRKSDCIVTAGDTVASTDYTKMVRAHREMHALVTVGVAPPDRILVGDAVLSPNLRDADIAKYRKWYRGPEEGFYRLILEVGPNFQVDQFYNLNTLSEYHRLLTDIAAGGAAWLLDSRRSLGVDAQERLPVRRPHGGLSP